MSDKVNTYFGFSMTVAIAVVGVVLLINSVMSSIVGGGSGMVSDMSPAAVAQRIKPVGKLNTGAAIKPVAKVAAAAPAAAPAAGNRSGEEVFNAVCHTCHIPGVAGAPKLGDSAAWAPRIDKGMDALLHTVYNGLNAMPIRGTCGDCTDEELKRTVEYMVSKAK